MPQNNNQTQSNPEVIARDLTNVCLLYTSQLYFLAVGVAVLQICLGNGAFIVDRRAGRGACCIYG